MANLHASKLAGIFFLEGYEQFYHYWVRIDESFHWLSYSDPNRNVLYVVEDWFQFNTLFFIIIASFFGDDIACMPVLCCVLW